VRDFSACVLGFEGEYLLYLTEKHGKQAGKICKAGERGLISDYLEQKTQQLNQYNYSVSLG